MIEGVIFEDGEYVYGKAYYDEYTRRGESISGIVLNTLRVKLAKKYTIGCLLDYGCGAGSFIKYMWDDNSIKCYGYDVNEYSIKWLNSKDLFFDVNYESFNDIGCVTFFDSFEHIKDHTAILNKLECSTYIIISIPVFEPVDAAYRSIHYKPGEHLWYFSDNGIKDYIERMGFSHVETSDIETRAGREGINTYVFRKRI